MTPERLREILYDARRSDVGKSKPDHNQYPPSETRPLRTDDLPGNATCRCSWCGGLPA